MILVLVGPQRSMLTQKIAQLALHVLNHIHISFSYHFLPHFLPPQLWFNLILSQKAQKYQKGPKNPTKRAKKLTKEKKPDKGAKNPKKSSKT